MELVHFKPFADTDGSVEGLLHTPILEMEERRETFPAVVLCPGGAYAFVSRFTATGKIEGNQRRKREVQQVCGQTVVLGKGQEMFPLHLSKGIPDMPFKSAHHFPNVQTGIPPERRSAQMRIGPVLPSGNTSFQVMPPYAFHIFRHIAHFINRRVPEIVLHGAVLPASLPASLVFCSLFYHKRD